MVAERAIHVTDSEIVTLDGDLVVPERPVGMVLFAHGSGSSRHSRRNRAVASHLHREHLGTLLLDLLTVEEERADAVTGYLRFDVEMLAGRLGAALRWLKQAEDVADLPVGMFGASTGAAAALIAAAEHPDDVLAVVSRGGRPDLAGRHLELVRCPTMLIVGGHDHAVIDLNRHARDQLTGETEFEVVPGATHLFEEPGALDVVAELATRWFSTHLPQHARLHR